MLKSSKQYFCNSVYPCGFCLDKLFWGSVLLPFNLPTGHVKLLIIICCVGCSQKNEHFHEGISTQMLNLLTIIVKPLNSLITDQIQDDF